MNQLVIEDDAGEYRLTAAEFQQQAAMPAAVEWFANLGNSRTYPNDLEDFCSFVGFRSFVRRSRSHARLARPVADRSHYPSRTGGVANLFNHRLESNAVASCTPGMELSGRRSTLIGKLTAFGDL